MRITEKLKTVGIKCNPPRYTTAELEHGINAGLELPYHIKLSGKSPRDNAAERRRYAKNFQKSHGLCVSCEHFNAKIKIVGKHCRLAESQHCTKD